MDLSNTNSLIIKQDYKNIKEKYKIYDDTECNNIKYIVSSEYKTWASKNYMYDNSNSSSSSNDKQLLYVIGEIVKFSQIHRRWEIHDGNNNLIANIKQHSLTKVQLDIKLVNGDGDNDNDNNENIDFIIKGSLMGTKYEILKDGIQIASIVKKKKTLIDQYQLEVNKEFDISLFAAFVITIDDCFHSNKSYNI